MILFISLIPLLVVILGFWFGTPDAGTVINANEAPRKAVRKGFRLMNNRDRLITLLTNSGHFLFGLYIDGVECLYERVMGVRPVRTVKRRLAWAVVLAQVIVLLILAADHYKVIEYLREVWNIQFL